MFGNPHLSPLAIIIPLALIVLLYIFLREGSLRFAAKPLLTQNEMEFYGRMRKAAPELAIFPQVAIRAFVRPGSSSGKKRYARELAHIGSKHCDFLICDPDSLAILAIVELDDKTHVLEKDVARDAMTGAAGYLTLRFQSKNKPSVAELRETFARLRQFSGHASPRIAA